MRSTTAFKRHIKTLFKFSFVYGASRASHMTDSVMRHRSNVESALEKPQLQLQFFQSCMPPAFAKNLLRLVSAR